MSVVSSEFNFLCESAAGQPFTGIVPVVRPLNRGKNVNVAPGHPVCVCVLFILAEVSTNLHVYIARWPVFLILIIVNINGCVPAHLSHSMASRQSSGPCAKLFASTHLKDVHATSRIANCFK